MGQAVHAGPVSPSTPGPSRAAGDVDAASRRARPRILVAIEPKLLGDAMATLLTEADQDDVEVLPLGGSPTGHYDGAVVTVDLAGLDAEVVIRLPDDAGGAGMGTATTRDQDREVYLRDARSVLLLLDVQVATATPRASVVPGR
jgi:hypothetical protein